MWCGILKVQEGLTRPIGEYLVEKPIFLGENKGLVHSSYYDNNNLYENIEAEKITAITALKYALNIGNIDLEKNLNSIKKQFYLIQQKYIEQATNIGEEELKYIRNEFIINYIKTSNPNEDANILLKEIIKNNNIDIEDDAWIMNVFNIIYLEKKDKIINNDIPSKIVDYYYLLMGGPAQEIAEDFQTGMQRTIRNYREKKIYQAKKLANEIEGKFFDNIKNIRREVLKGANTIRAGFMMSSGFLIYKALAYLYYISQSFFSRKKMKRRRRTKEEMLEDYINSIDPNNKRLVRDLDSRGLRALPQGIAANVIRYRRNPSGTGGYRYNIPINRTLRTIMKTPAGKKSRKRNKIKKTRRKRMKKKNKTPRRRRTKKYK